MIQAIENMKAQIESMSDAAFEIACNDIAKLSEVEENLSEIEIGQAITDIFTLVMRRSHDMNKVKIIHKSRIVDIVLKHVNSLPRS